MKKINCPVCGSEMEVNEETGFANCKSCGCKVQTFDHTELKKEEKTIKIIDEARQKEADLASKKLDFEKEKQEKAIRNKKINLIIGLSALAIGIILLIISLACPKNSDDSLNAANYLMIPGIAGIALGIVFLKFVFPKKKNEK